METGHTKSVMDVGGAEEQGPLRTCIVTRAQKSPEEMIRFVRAPDGDVVPDLARRLPGRGVWVTGTREAVKSAVSGKGFARSFKKAVKAAPDLGERVEVLLRKRLAEAVAIANKAGLAVAGFAKVDALIGSGEAIVLLHGTEAAGDGRLKLDRKLAAVAAARGRETAIVDALSIAELSLAFGRENVVHAALREGGAARRVMTEAERLTRYRSGIGTPSAFPAPELNESCETDIA